jgi:hypothetical protein
MGIAVSLCALLFAALLVCIGWCTGMAVVPDGEGFEWLATGSAQAASFGFLLSACDPWSRH